MNKKIKTLLKMLILALGLLGLFIVITKKMKPEEIKDAETIYDFAMGTSVTIKLYGVEDEEIYAGDIVTRINDISDNLISWRVEKSQLYDLNNNYKTGEKFAILTTSQLFIHIFKKHAENTASAIVYFVLSSFLSRGYR